MNDFSHLKNKLLAEQVEDQIYHYILDTPIEPGAKLPNEFELGEKFGVGRSTVREAVKLLSSKGIVEVRRGSVLDHELRLNSSKILEMNERQIPTGKLLDAAGTPQDFREFRSFRPGISSEFNHIRDFKGYDHPFVVDGWKPNILGEVGTLREPRSGRSVTVLSSQPSVMIYTGNWLAGGCPETKSGGRYADYDGVAMECQNYPDAVNHPEFPSPLLRPGETYCQKIVFRFGTFA